MHGNHTACLINVRSNLHTPGVLRALRVSIGLCSDGGRWSGGSRKFAGRSAASCVGSAAFLSYHQAQGIPTLHFGWECTRERQCNQRANGYRGPQGAHGGDCSLMLRSPKFFNLRSIDLLTWFWSSSMLRGRCTRRSSIHAQHGLWRSIAPWGRQPSVFFAGIADWYCGYCNGKDLSWEDTCNGST